MKFVRKHKITSFVIAVYIVGVIFSYFIYKLFIGSNGLPVYGDRLDGLENVKITSDEYANIKNKIMEDESVINVSDIDLRGRIINVVITVGDNAEVSKSKNLANIVKDSLTEAQNNYYDIQVFIVKKYDCFLRATGNITEEGEFTGKVVVTFENDLKTSTTTLNYGLSDTNNKDYNKKEEYVITEDGNYEIFGFTQDKTGESTCSIKIVKKTTDEKATSETLTSTLNRNFPIIGYKKYGKSEFSWTKDR